MFKKYIQQKDHLFENVSVVYRKRMIEIFNKAIKDELSSGALYMMMASRMSGFNEEEIAEELIKHGKEEFEHYQQLLEYAGNHGIAQDLDLALMPYTQVIPSELNEIIQLKQRLEQEALDDYSNAVLLAQEEGDFLTKRFFTELAEDERRHLDDVQKYLKTPKYW